VDETNTTAEKIIYFSTSTRPAFGPGSAPTAPPSAVPRHGPRL